MKILTIIKKMFKIKYVLCWTILLSFIGSTQAENKLIVTAEADVSVSEDNPDRLPTRVTEHLLSAGIGRGKKEGRLVSYLKFDLSEIPDSSLFHYISIDSGKLSLLAHSFGLAGKDKRFIVPVNYCPDTNWSEDKLTWNSRVCKDGLEGEDSVIIDGKDLPKIFKWDVTKGIALAKANGNSKVTLVVEAYRLFDCSRDPLEGKGCKDDAKWVGAVRFASSERSKFGVSVMPNLMISHSSHPTAILRFLNSTIAILSAIGVAAGLYELFRRKRNKKKVQ